MPISFDWSNALSTLPVQFIPASWLDTKGSGVKVAFVDTGANLNLALLKHLDKPGHKFFTGAPGFSVTKLIGKDSVFDSFGAEDRGHGNKYLSLLAGKKPDDSNFNGDVVSGLANAAEYFIIKARDKTDKKTTIRNFLNALELASNLNVEVFITGQNIPLDEMSSEGIDALELKRVFELPGVQKMFIFAPLENRATEEPWDNIVSNYFPSLRPEVINVAELPQDFDQVFDIIENQEIHFLLVGFTGKLLAKNGTATEISSFSNSGAVAIAGGIATLAISFFKNQNAGQLPNKTQLLNLLNECCMPINDALGPFNAPAIFKKNKPGNS